GRVKTSENGVGVRSAESSRSTHRRLDAAIWLAKFCWRRTLADALRPDARRAGLVVHQNHQARCRVSCYRDASLAARCCARIRLADWRADVDQSQSKCIKFMDGSRPCGDV